MSKRAFESIFCNTARAYDTILAEMTSKDHRDIKTLYFIHRFKLASIARLYAVSHTRIQQVLHNKTTTVTSVVSDTECLICGLEEITNPYYIDGDDMNHNPQNVLQLCEADTRRFSHLRRRSATHLA